MNVILWVILGALAGWIASMLMRTNEQQGFIMDVIVGIIGAIIGGFIITIFGGQGVTGFNLYSLLVAVVGAVILLGITRLFKRS